MIFGFIEEDVQVGIVPVHGVSDAERHGSVTVQFRGFTMKIPYQVDHPKRLNNPSKDVLRSMFRQFDQMGLEVVDLEIAAGNRHRVWRREGEKFLLTQTAHF